jgi:hypothetical protein
MPPTSMMRAARIADMERAAALVGPPASAVTIDWVIVRNPGNAPDTEVMADGTTGYGSVAGTRGVSRRSKDPRWT